MTRSRINRREFFAHVGTVAVAGAVGHQYLAAQSADFRIDTHHHYTIPALRDQLMKAGQQPMLNWSIDKSLSDMDRAGVATAMLSVGEPGIWFGDDAAARGIARQCNDYGAELVQKYPGRFGVFAALPLPDVQGSLREIEYAFDVLKVDGVCLLSSYQGRYLGNPLFAPVMDELHRRKAVVYCHPTCAACFVGGAYRTELPENQNRGVEYVFDTTRAIVSVLGSGTVTRCPDIRFIWSHAGGTVPFITGRLANIAPNPPNGINVELQKFFYDTALAFSPYTLAAFKKFVPVTQILFGSDYPFGAGSAVSVVNGLRADDTFSVAELRAIERDNALALLPRLRV